MMTGDAFCGHYYVHFYPLTSYKLDFISNLVHVWR